MNMSTTYFRPKAMNAKESPHSRTRIFPIIVDISGHIAIGMIGILQWEKIYVRVMIIQYKYMSGLHKKCKHNTTQNKYSNTLPGNTWKIRLSYDINVYWWWIMFTCPGIRLQHTTVYIKLTIIYWYFLTTIYTFLNFWNWLFFVRKWAVFLSRIS